MFDAAFRPQGIETPMLMLHMAFTPTYPMGHRPGAVWESRSASPLPDAFTALLLTKHIKSSAWERGNCSGYSSLKYSRALAKARNANLKEAQRNK